MKARKKRRDAGRSLWTERDIAALTWIAHQYAIRLDHLQILLGRLGDQGSYPGTARTLVSRWRNAGWVHVQRMCINERVWISVTSSALHALDLPYRAVDVDQCSLGTLKAWAAINEVRLCYENEQMQWRSQRQLLAEMRKTRVLPDAEVQRQDGLPIAIKVVPGQQTMEEQEKWVLEFLRKPYSEIWYVAALSSVRRQMRAVCAGLLDWQEVTEEDARRMVVKGFDFVEDDEVLPEPTSASKERARPRRIRSRRMNARGEPQVINTDSLAGAAGTPNEREERFDQDELTAIFNAVPLASDDSPPVVESKRRNHRHQRSRRMKRETE